MAKRRKFRDIRVINYPYHKYDWGGDFKKAFGYGAEGGPSGMFDFKNTFSGANVGNMAKGLLPAAAGAVGKIGGNLISGGKTGGGGEVISGIGSTIGGAVGAVNPLLGAGITAVSGLVGGLSDAAFGSKMNDEFIQQTEQNIAALQAKTFDTSSTSGFLASVGGGLSDMSLVRESDVGEDGWFSDKAEDKTDELNEEIRMANIAAAKKLENAGKMVNDTNRDALFSNVKAFGGFFNNPYGMFNFGMSPISYELANENLAIKAAEVEGKNKITSMPNSFSGGGKIHIKPSKRGTFTAAANKRGMGVQEFASKVLANKEDYSTAMVKKANFARNAAKWHADGGLLGGDFTNGIIMIGNGGTHEQNPMEGVQMGVDNQGIPNLVEEGEVIFNDYVFSNRLKVPDAVKQKYKLKGNKKLTFADAAKQMQKESEERPNDPISKRGLNDAMLKLLQEQEYLRLRKLQSELSKQYAKGGKLGRLYSGEEDEEYPNQLELQDPIGISVPELLPTTISMPKGYDDETLRKKYWGEDEKKNSSNSWLRYAPVAGNIFSLIDNYTSSPDYSDAKAIEDAAIAAGEYTPVGFTPVSNKLQYKPLDKLFYLNRLQGQSGATRRAIMNSSSPSRYAALLAADYNANEQLGNLIRQAEEYDLAQRKAVEEFNRGTEMANSEMAIKAAMANQQARAAADKARLTGITTARTMRDKIDAQRAAALSLNWSNLFESLGGIGIEGYNRNMIMSNPALYYSIDSKGNITYKNGYESLSEAEKKEVRDAANKAKSKKAKGGYLTIKKGGRHG